MAHKLFSTGPGILRRVERKETIDGLDQSEMVFGKNEYPGTYNNQHRKEEW